MSIIKASGTLLALSRYPRRTGRQRLLARLGSCGVAKCISDLELLCR